MTDVSVAAPPDLDEAPGWIVTDPDGNVVASGPLVELEVVTDAGPAECGEGCDC
jgi:hypothetical protein